MSGRKCFAHHFLTFEEYGLYTYAREVSHESEILYFDGRKLAGRFSGEGKYAAYRIKDRLVEKGWFHVLKKSKRDRNTGIFKPSELKPLSLKEWAEKHPKQYADCEICKASGLAIQTGTSPENRTGNERYSPENRNDQSWNQEQPVLKTGMTSLENRTQSDKENLIKRKGKRESNQPTGVDGWLALLPKILEEQTDRMYRMTEAEAEQLERLGNTYGCIPVLAAFCQFSQRPEGFTGLFKPFTLFVQEADRWIERAYQEAYDFAQISCWPNGQRFLTTLDAPDAHIGEDKKWLLFTVWTTLELNKDLLTMLVEEQNQHEQPVAIVEMNREPHAVSV